jgi:hypothetical protein
MDVKITANDNVAVYFGFYPYLPLKVVHWKTFIVEPAKLLNKFPSSFAYSSNTLLLVLRL